jgi:hypothetical protein
VLPVHAADAVPAAPEREPEGQAGLEQPPNRLVRLGVSNEGQRLEQEEVRRLLLEHLREELDRPFAPRRVDFVGDRERHGAFVASPLVLDRLPRQPDAEPADVHPVRQLCAPGVGTEIDLRRGQDRPRVGGDDVAAGGDVAGMHFADILGSPIQGPRAPELGIRLGLAPPRAKALDLGRDASVEDDAALGGEQLLEVPVRR